MVAYESFIKTKEKSSWVIPKLVTVAYEIFSLQSLSYSSNRVSQRWNKSWSLTTVVARRALTVQNEATIVEVRSSMSELEMKLSHNMRPATCDLRIRPAVSDWGFWHVRRYASGSTSGSAVSRHIVGRSHARKSSPKVQLLNSAR